MEDPGYPPARPSLKENMDTEPSFSLSLAWEQSANGGATMDEETPTDDQDGPPPKRPSDAATTQAFVSTLQIIAACVAVFFGVASIPDFFIMQQTFWKELMNRFIEIGQKANCTDIYECIPEAGVWCVANCTETQDPNILVDIWPASISQSISVTNELTGVILNGFMTLAALFYMNSQMGKASIFPTEAGRQGAVFNFFRWFCPFVTMYLVPNTPIFYHRAEINEVWGLLQYGILGMNSGKSLQTNFFHNLYAFLGFLFGPILEFIHLILSIKQYPRIYGPLLVQDDSWSRFPPVLGKSYKALWFFFQFMRGVAIVLTLYVFVSMLMNFDTSDSIKGLKFFGYECLLGQYLATNYMFLSLTLLVATGKGNIWALTQIIPVLGLTLYMFISTIQTNIALGQVDSDLLAYLGGKVVHLGCNIANFGGDFIQWLPASETCVYPVDAPLSAP